MIARAIKFIIDTIMHGRILYDIYGFGWQLIASFWDSLTNFLSHRNSMRQTTTGKNDTPKPTPRQAVRWQCSEEIYVPMEKRTSNDKGNTSG